jgi:hypothetical protein
LEKQIAMDVRKAHWLTDADEAAVMTAKTLARKIDERIALAEASAESTLFEAGAPLPLAEMGGGLTYDLAALSQMLDGLGLTPRGRYQNSIDAGLPEEDELADLRIISLDDGQA